MVKLSKSRVSDKVPVGSIHILYRYPNFLVAQSKKASVPKPACFDRTPTCDKELDTGRVIASIASRG